MAGSNVRAWLLASVCLGGLLVGCDASIPEATFGCVSDSECPPGMRCHPDSLCRSTAPADGGVDASDGAMDGAPPCEPLTDCLEARAECGQVPDGCDGFIDCGECVAPETCGAGDIAFICDCVPTTCADAGAACGTVDDGCGRTLDCGGCPASDECIGGVCQCQAETCADVGAACGSIPDGCGGILSCGSCPDPTEVCGGSGVANVCGVGVCTPTTCGSVGAECGTIADGCGGIVTCPTCGAPEVCGALFANQCDCLPITCDAAGANCDDPPDGCGGTLDCGSCLDPDTCGGGGTPFLCGCAPATCSELGAECGTVETGCGPAFCGSCGPLASCGSNQCECRPDGRESNDDLSSAAALGMGRQVFPFSQVEDGAGTHSDGDEDYYGVDVAEPSAGALDGLTIAANLQDLPVGSEYVLELTYICPRGDPEVFSCVEGTRLSSGDGASPTCVSDAGASPSARATVRCSTESVSNAQVVVAVLPKVWLGQCEPYRLQVTGGVSTVGTL